MHPYYHPLFLKFIVYFNRNQDYFECHEVLEDYWKTFDHFNKNHPLTAYILLSTGLYHWRRGNMNGATRTLVKAQSRFLLFHDNEIYKEKIDFQRLYDDTKAAILAVKNNDSFFPVKLYISSEQLQKLVDSLTATMELLPIGSDAVIHKHMLRDRSDILQLREEKKRGRSNY